MRAFPCLFATIAFVMALAACSTPEDPMIMDPEAFVTNATVEFLSLEGGCWALRLDERTRYQPINLQERYRIDGLAVRAAVKFRRDMGSYCMIGEMVEILWIRER